MSDRPKRRACVAAATAKASVLEAIFIKEEILSDTEEPAQEPIELEANASPPNKPFCALCLWECPPDVEVLSQPDIAEHQKKLEEIIGPNVNINDGVVCRTCWKLVDIVGDFRKFCINSASWINQFSRGMQYEVNTDGWRSKELIDSMNVLHKAIQKNMDLMEQKKFKLMNPPVIASETEMEKKNVSITGVDNVSMELKNETKEEPLEIDKKSDCNDMDEDTVKNQEEIGHLSVLTCEKCGREFEKYKGLQIHARHCGRNAARAKRKRKKSKLKAKSEGDSANDHAAEENNSENEGYRSEIDEIVLIGEDNYKPTIYTCEKCGRKLDGTIAHFMHSKRCVVGKKTDNFACKICNATFKSLSGLRYHMNRHNGIKPFKCRKFCNKTFYSNFVRIKHEDGMCEMDRRVCPICGAQLKNAFSLRKHLAQVHGEAKHPCDKCDTTCRTREALKLHQRVHSEVRKYSCDICDKAYKSPYAVKIHMRVHTLEKPYACRLCDQAFRYNVTLKSHMERKHRQKA